jgi:hypothetical protein
MSLADVDRFSKVFLLVLGSVTVWFCASALRCRLDVRRGQLVVVNLCRQYSVGGSAFRGATVGTFSLMLEIAGHRKVPVTALQVANYELGRKSPSRAQRVALHLNEVRERLVVEDPAGGEVQVKATRPPLEAVVMILLMLGAAVVGL